MFADDTKIWCRISRLPEMTPWAYRKYLGREYNQHLVKQCSRATNWIILLDAI